MADQFRALPVESQAMALALNWIDHDAAARERTSIRVLSLFQEKESWDELGLGGVRDSIADQPLFPGTSTIQTRLRSMLLVPRIPRSLKEERVPPGDFAARADRMERDLVRSLLRSDDRSGVLVKMAGRGMKRVPSSVYSAGLGAWGIRLIDASQDQYHRHVGALYPRRAEQLTRQNERARMGDDREAPPNTTRALGSSSCPARRTGWSEVADA